MTYPQEASPTRRLAPTQLSLSKAAKGNGQAACAVSVLKRLTCAILQMLQALPRKAPAKSAVRL